jgi:capsular polysaccharide biosynthesis protein
MELIALWEVLRRRWWLILLPTLVVFLSLLPTFPAMLRGSTSYTVAMRFTAASASDAILESNPSYEDSAYVPWLASEYVVVNLPQWVTSDSFTREVSTELATHGLVIPFEEVRSAFVADSARSILVVYIAWDDASEIELIANAAVKVLQTRNQAYFPQFAAYPAQVQALDDVRVNPLATPLMTRFSPLLRLVVGFAAGIALALLVEYLDDTVHKGEDLGALDLNLLGQIPRE